MGSPQNETETVTTESIGARLKRERLSKHITLEEIAETTRVNIETLQAIEDDDKSKLPARVFVQGFIRLYAKHVGLDPEEILSHYTKDSDDTIETRKRINVREILESESMAESPSFMSSKQILFIILILLLGFLIYIGRQNYFPDQKTTEPASNAQVEETIQTPTTETEEQPVAPVEEETPPQEPETETAVEEPKPAEPGDIQPIVKQEYVLKANFTERTWVWIQVDNNEPREYLFQTGENFKWVAHNKIDINLGNAGGVDLVLNGKPIPKIGISGQVVRLSMPDAAQTILNSPDNAP